MTSKILLLSYPRSGNSLVKYFVKRSLNLNKVNDCAFQKLIKRGKELDNKWLTNQFIAGNILFKEHFSTYCKYFDDKNDSLIFVVRNYKECLIRHNGIAKLMRADKMKAECKKYAENIDYFYNWKGKKVILYYENLIKNFKKEYCKILDIIDVDMRLHDMLFKNLNDNKNKCLRQYSKVCGSVTKGQHEIYHSKTLRKDIADKFDKFVKNNISVDGISLIKRYV